MHPVDNLLSYRVSAACKLSISQVLGCTGTILQIENGCLAYTCPSACRIGNLMRMCHTWHGAISAAVYLPLSPQSGAATAHAAMEHLDRWHSDNEKLGKSPGSCSLSLTGPALVQCSFLPLVRMASAGLNALRQQVLLQAHVR